MDKELSSAFRHELQVARVGYTEGDLDRAFRHLERAHILGQRALLPHIVTHWLMLKIGMRRSDAREVRGQIARMIAAVFGYVFGWVPLGNTGGANVSPIRPMQVPAEFARFFEGHDVLLQRRQRLVAVAIITLIGISTFARNGWALTGGLVQAVTPS
jgi:hypothetical protein